MASVVPSEQVQFRLDSMPAEAKAALEQRFDYLRDMPRMYAVTDDERYPGCRSFWVDPCFRVFYMIAAGSDDVYVVAVTEEEVDLAEEA